MSCILLSILLFGLSIVGQASCGYLITIDAHETVCFYDHAHVKNKITISFEVMEGGFKDISVYISGPKHNEVHRSEKETKGSYTFTATDHGEYTLCFDNERSTLTPKILMFHFTVFRDFNFYVNPALRMDDIVEQAALQEAVSSLSSQMLGIKHELEYIRLRYNGHEEINQSVNFRVVVWSIFGPSLLLLTTLIEVYYLKRFFEVKRVV